MPNSILTHHSILKHHSFLTHHSFVTHRCRQLLAALAFSGLMVTGCSERKSAMPADGTAQGGVASDTNSTNSAQVDAEAGNQETSPAIDPPAP